MEQWYIDPMGRGASGVRSIKCLNGKCKGTLVGEEKMSLYYFMTLSTCFYYVEEPFPGAMDVATIFPLF